MNFFRIALALACLFSAGCGKPPDGRVHVSYWEIWTGTEGEAMQKVVDAFNRSQDRVVVEYLAVSQVDRKTIMAIAGGDPPDVAGLGSYHVCLFVDNHALTPLDDFIRREGLTVEQWLERYSPVYAELCSYRGTVWALPSAPAVIALHWNKALFRNAGLDPERPPRTVEELDFFAEKLTKRDPATGRITQLGFLPQEPGWYAWAFPQWFGGRIWDESGITIGKYPENEAAYRWAQGYTLKYGLEAIKAFTSGFVSSDSSPQNSFLSSKVAMIFQGVWLNNFISRFSPGLEFGVAPFPVAKPGLENFTIAESNILAIPRGARHPGEAWEFIKYVNSANLKAQSFDELAEVELLCYLQKKNSPLRQWSPFFEKHHPHPCINVFRQLANSPNAIHMPRMGIWPEYSRELSFLFENVRLLRLTPRQAIDLAQKRSEQSWARYQRKLDRRKLDLVNHSTTAIHETTK